MQNQTNNTNKKEKKSSWTKPSIIIAIASLFLGLVSNYLQYANNEKVVVIYQEENKNLNEQNKKLFEENKNLQEDINKIKEKNEQNVVNKDKSEYVQLDEENFVIKFNQRILGYLYIPKITNQFYLYLQDWNGSTKPGTTEILAGNINKIELLNKLGKYIDTANSIPKRLIISANDELFKWEAANRLKWSKEKDNLKPLKNSKMWSPQRDEIYDMQGCFNCP